MKWSRVWAIFQKEWVEIKSNKMILGAMWILPLTFIVMVVGTAMAMINASPADFITFIPPPELSHLEPQEAYLVILNDQYIFYLWMIPMIIPVSIAAYSIIGEKEARSLEPLLATPVTTGELLLGKAFSASIPATAVGILSYALCALGLIIVTGWDVASFFVRPLWIVSMLLLSPLLAGVSTFFGILVSARVTDIRAAQGIAGMGVIPVIGVSVYILLGEVLLDVQFLLWSLAILVPANVGLLFLSIRLFQRERILTRWK